MPQNHEISVIDPKDGHEITFPNIWHFYVMDFFEDFFSIWPWLRFQSGQALWIESLLCVGEWNVLCVLSSLRVGDSIRAVKTVIKWARGWNKISDRNSREFKPKDLPSHTHIHSLNRWTKDFTNLQDFSIFGRISRLLKFWNPKMGFLI